MEFRKPTPSNTLVTFSENSRGGGGEGGGGRPILVYSVAH